MGVSDGAGGKGTFGDTGGYGGGFNASGGGLNNRSGQMGGNPTNISGGASDFGAFQAAASRLGMPASSMNASANQAMAAFGYVLGPNGTWQSPAAAGMKKSESTPTKTTKTKVPVPKTMPVVKIVKNSITGQLTAIDDVTGQPIPNYDFTMPYSPQPWDNYPLGGIPQTPAPPKTITDRVYPNYDVNMGPILQDAYSDQSIAQPGMRGTHTVGGLVSGNVGTGFGPRGLAMGGISGPGEEVIVGENGPERMMAPAGAVVQPFKVGAPNLSLMHDNWRRRAIVDAARMPNSGETKRQSQAQSIREGLRKQRRRA